VQLVVVLRKRFGARAVGGFVTATLVESALVVASTTQLLTQPPPLECRVACSWLGLRHLAALHASGSLAVARMAVWSRRKP